MKNAKLIDGKWMCLTWTSFSRRFLFLILLVVRGFSLLSVCLFLLFVCLFGFLCVECCFVVVLSVQEPYSWQLSHIAHCRQLLAVHQYPKRTW